MPVFNSFLNSSIQSKLSSKNDRIGAVKTIKMLAEREQLHQQCKKKIVTFLPPLFLFLTTFFWCKRSACREVYMSRPLYYISYIHIGHKYMNAGLSWIHMSWSDLNRSILCQILRCIFFLLCHGHVFGLLISLPFL